MSSGLLCLTQGQVSLSISGIKPETLYLWDNESPAIQPVQCWIGPKVSDAYPGTPHKPRSRCLSVPETSEMINSCGIPFEMALKLQHPCSIPHAKIHWQPWPFCVLVVDPLCHPQLAGSRINKIRLVQNLYIKLLFSVHELGFGKLTQQKKQRRMI